jgi:hypothetical protein
MVATSRGGYLNTILWKTDKESRYLAFLTAIEDVPKLAIHFFQAANGWRTFVCRRNEIYEDESNGECAICEMAERDLEDGDKKESRFKANWKHFAIAVELEPIEERVNGKKQITGFELKMETYENKAGEEVTVPVFGLVSQALTNFWTPLSVMVDRKGDLTEQVIEVVRSGGKKSKVSYNFFDYPGREQVDVLLEEYEDRIPSLIDWITEKGSKEHYDRELDGFDPEAEEDEGEQSASTDSQDDSTQKSQSKFDELKSQLESRNEGTSGDEAA